MAELLLGAAALVLVAVAAGLVRVLRGPGDADRMGAAQLLGSGGAAVLVLVSAATRTPAVVDVAIVLTLVSAFASAAFAVHAGGRRDAAADGE